MEELNKIPMDKPSSAEEELKYALNQLDECVHRFCCFKESFMTFCEKKGLINEN